MTNTVEKSKSILKAKKLLELANRGIDGEKETAKVKLSEHLKKYGIDISEIDDTINVREFKFGSSDEFTILSNVILSVNPFAKLFNEKGVVSCELDKEDYLEVKNKHKHFWGLWKIEYDLLILSFFTQNSIHFRPDEYAYNKNGGSGQKENPAFKKNARENKKMNKNIDEVIEMTPPKEFSEKETAKQSIDRMNLQRMQNMLHIMLKSNYRRGQKV